VPIKICILIPTAVVIKGRPEGLRRNLYFTLERYAYRTPFGWVIDYEVCEDLLKARLVKMNEEFKSLTNTPLFRLLVAVVDESQLEELLASREREPLSEIGKKLEEKLRKHRARVVEQG